MNVIYLRDLRHHASLGTIAEVRIVASSKGYYVDVLATSGFALRLYTDRLKVRHFPNPQTALKILYEAGISKCTVDMTAWGDFMANQKAANGN